MDVKFYKCMHCGNIAVKVFDAGVPLVCCGEKMVELVAGSQDAALEKHVPAVEVEGNKVVVNVGSVDHPMLEEHWIQFICLVTDKGYQIHPLAPGEAPHAEFVIAEGETPAQGLRALQPPRPVGDRDLNARSRSEMRKTRVARVFFLHSGKTMLI